MAAVGSTDRALTTVAEALAAETKILITCHVNPDGDALGSVIALHLALSSLGADSVMYLSQTDPVAPEWCFLGGLKQIIKGDLPADYQLRTLVALDCGSAERIGNEELVKSSPRIINIDHHADNTRFGEINLVVNGASSTAEILFFIMQKMGFDITAEISEALYTGILVDSGRFQYASASPTTFRVAADLIGRGARHTDIFRHVYETVPLAKTRLSCRMFDHLSLACDGRLAVSVLEAEDFRQAAAGDNLTEGLVDSLRAIEGVIVAALIYAKPDQEKAEASSYRLSLRSSSGAVNVQRIAKAKGGGGHPQAAGASINGETAAQITEFLADRVNRAIARAGLK